MLLKKKSLHAWDLQDLIEEQFGFTPGKITPYRVLYRLENDGFVKSEQKERRRMYEITAKGEKELKKAKLYYKGLIEFF